MSPAPEVPPAGSPQARPRRKWLVAILTLVSLAIAAMWVYAFVFAPRDGVNPVRDKVWTDTVGARCTAASAQLKPLVFRTKITEGNKAQDLPAFVANLDKGYAIVHSMLDDIEQVPRTSDKAKVLVPQWMTDYRLWEKDLKDWIELLRAGKIAQFGVAVTETGIPVNERINTFATENRIKACSTDLLTA
jgi:hypothetical protein